MAVDPQIILYGLAGSAAGGIATGLGALPLLVMAKPSEQRQTSLLGFAAGVMLAASFFSLIIPAIAVTQERGASQTEAAALVAVAVLLGAGVLALLNRAVPPLKEVGLGPAGIAEASVRRIWLFVAAITLHNVPEGLAVGVSFGGGDVQAGIATALGIAIQDIPEGLAVGVSLLSIGYSRGRAVFYALLSGLVEPVAGLIGVTLVQSMTVLLPWGLGFAAGAMIWVVASEIIPTAQRAGGTGATPALMVGLVMMMFLDVSLG